MTLLPSPIKTGEAYTYYSKTQLELETTLQDFYAGKQAYAYGDYDRSIASYSHVIDQLQSSLSTVLLHRAAAYEQQNKHTMALQDTHAANPEKNTTCPDAYHASASAYYLLGQPRDALVIYRQGKEAVPLDHPARHHLDKKLDILMDVINKQNQLWAKLLPTEVMFSILYQLPIQSRLMLAFTCRFWKEYIMYQLHLTNPWHIVQYTEKDWLSCEEIDHRTMMDWMRQKIPCGLVKKVVLGNTDRQKCSASHDAKQLLDIIAEQGWNQITSLDIGRFKRESLETIIASNCKTLQQLAWYIRDDDKENDGRMGELVVDLIQLCPQLKLVEFNNETCERSWVDYLGGTNHFTNIILALASSSITTSELPLSLFRLSYKMDIQRLVFILETSTYLTSLTINSLAYKDDLGTILKALNNTYKNYLPALEEFQFRKINSTTTSPWTNVAQYTTQQQQTTSLSPPVRRLKKLALELSDELSHSADQQLCSLLFKAYKTLEEVVLDFGHYNLRGSHESIYALSQLGTTHLKSLMVRSTYLFGAVNPELFADLIRSSSSSPLFESIQLRGTCFWTRNTFEALGTLTRLKTLRLEYESSPPPSKSVPSSQEEENESSPENDKQEQQQQVVKQYAEVPHDLIFPNPSWLEPLWTTSTLTTFAYINNNTSLMDTEEGAKFLLGLTQSLAIHSRIHTLDLGNVYLRQAHALPILRHLSQLNTLCRLSILIPYEALFYQVLSKESSSDEDDGVTVTEGKDKDGFVLDKDMVDVLTSMTSLGDLSIKVLLATKKENPPFNENKVVNRLLDQWKSGRFIFICMQYVKEVGGHDRIEAGCKLSSDN
ncbi:hypothetical protein BDA99DRAFT_570792 [Phascolomyces articulosus]|uniref:F-box domain-containing protein n=1 Tax=Phascolomyces articulosus TaxID=60185 RepID=A0AAD5K406_9FUNG|nr:hypothetical protein BDA99DRAFT_570792 [Phascolomyces articulosus]